MFDGPLQFAPRKHRSGLGPKHVQALYQTISGRAVVEHSTGSSLDFPHCSRRRFWLCKAAFTAIKIVVRRSMLLDVAANFLAAGRSFDRLVKEFWKATQRQFRVAAARFAASQQVNDDCSFAVQAVFAAQL
ncbi:hypothetical protein [Novosphingobium sp. FKTRR1]|uniref:hypothetical protein n=1 Tax=Novosphingobium sp. FKTRR1 TaxID=2879118 RepID=UPI001CF0AD2D|nr:hypothetical protein [Novosphingobium sp. FKTRR1]